MSEVTKIYHEYKDGIMNVLMCTAKDITSDNFMDSSYVTHFVVEESMIKHFRDEVLCAVIDVDNKYCVLKWSDYRVDNYVFLVSEFKNMDYLPRFKQLQQFILKYAPVPLTPIQHKPSVDKSREITIVSTDHSVELKKTSIDKILDILKRTKIKDISFSYSHLDR